MTAFDEGTRRAFHELRGKKHSIIGYGNIGSQVSVLAESLGNESDFFMTLETKLPMGNAEDTKSLKDLWDRRMWVTLHAGKLRKTKNLINKTNL